VQTLAHLPQPTHFELLIEALLLLNDIAPEPHTDTHLAQPVHLLELTLYVSLFDVHDAKVPVIETIPTTAVAPTSFFKKFRRLLLIGSFIVLLVFLSEINVKNQVSIQL
jgi:hypothetical protein